MTLDLDELERRQVFGTCEESTNNNQRDWQAMINEIRNLRAHVTESLQGSINGLVDGKPYHFIAGWMSAVVKSEADSSHSELEKLEARFQLAKTCLEYCATSPQAIRKDIRTEAKQLLGAMEITG